MTVETLIPIAYLIAAVTFILGLKGLSSPTTAVQGNRIAAAGMLIANLGDEPVHNGSAHWIKLSAQMDGSFTVTNARNGFSKSYRP